MVAERQSRAMRADQVLLAVQRRHKKDLWLTEVRTGPSQSAPKGQLHRIDGLALAKSWTAPLITGYEVKVDRQDWIRDNKWHAALDDCHAFYIACPKDLIQPNEVPQEVGLIWIRDSGLLSIQRKAVYRNIELPTLLLYHVCMSRIDSDRHPFFSERRLQLEAAVKDAASRRDLAEAVGGATRRSLIDAETRARNAEDDAAQEREHAERWRQARSILESHGIRADRWADWQKDLRTALAGGGTDRLRRACKDLSTQVAAIMALFQPDESAGGE